jgi:hypothetical protein
MIKLKHPNIKEKKRTVSKNPNGMKVLNEINELIQS